MTRSQAASILKRKDSTPEERRLAAAFMGRSGGKATGYSKRRNTEDPEYYQRVGKKGAMVRKLRRSQ